MSKTPLDLGTLLDGGLALFRRRPRAVVVWTLIYVAATAGADLAVRQILMSNPAGQGGGLSIFLIQLLLVLVSPVLLTAAMRALLRPRETDFVSLDASMDELRVIVIAFVLSLAFAVIDLVCNLVLGRFVLATLSPAIALMALLVPLLIAACLFARLSLAFPLALVHRRIQFEEAWELSAGLFLPFFLAYAIIAIGMILLGLAISAAMNWATLAVLSGGQVIGPSAVQPLRIITPVDGLTMLSWLLYGIQGTFGVVFTAGVMVAGKRALVPDTEELTDTFS